MKYKRKYLKLKTLQIGGNYKNKYIIVADWLTTYITQEHYYFCKNLEKYGWKIILLSQLNDKINELKNNCIILCCVYDGYDISNLKTNENIVIYKIDDLYPEQYIRRINIQNADIVISPYAYLLENRGVYNINIKQLYHIPYSAVDSFFQNIQFNNNPKKKIFVSGAIGPGYPFRHYVTTLNNSHIERLVDDRIQKHGVINKKYYEKLNEYLCCFTCATKYNYVLLKVFEITSVGSLLLVEDSIKNQLNILGFYDNLNCIMCNKDNLIEKINWIMDDTNIGLINNMRIKGMELSRLKHATSMRSDKFNNIINKLYFQ